MPSFVEFETANDLRTAVEKLDGREFKGQRVQCVANVGVALVGSPLLYGYLTIKHRLSRTSRRGTEAAPDPLAVDLTRFPPTTMTAEHLEEALLTALVAMVATVTAAIATAAPAVITTMTAPDTGHLLVAAPP